MHVLVTGGTGFIGKALCRALRARGDQVSVLTRSAIRAYTVLPKDVAALESLDGLRGVDAVVNLAGENLVAGRWTEARKRRMLDSRLGITRSLIDWMAHGPAPGVLLSGSAVGWYGARGEETLTEDAPPGSADEFQVRLCSAWEAEAAKATELGVRTCLLRTGLVLERDGGTLKAMLRPFRLGLGGPMGSGEQWMSWIHRDDHVALMLWLLDRDSARGAYNLTAPEPVRHREFVEALGRALHRPTVLRMPGFALKALVGELADLILTGQKVLPRRALDDGFVFRYPDLGGALAAVLHTRKAA